MKIKEFIEFLKQNYNEEVLIIYAIQDYLKTASNTENEMALQTAFDTIKAISWKDKSSRMILTQQLTQTKMYLKGEMYTNEETAKQMLYKQIINIEEVLNNEIHK